MQFIVFFLLSATVYRMYLEVLLLLVFQIAVHRQVQIAKKERGEDVTKSVRETAETVKEEPKRYERAFSAGVEVIICFPR